jgi:GTP-binding protein Era
MSEAQGPPGEPAKADTFRCGHVALVGRPNVGKSTLLNRLVGQKLSIVTAKPQTTRQQIAGIKTRPEGQIVYLDTPGIHLAATRALNRYMNRVARAALTGVDAVLFLIEAGRWTQEDEHVMQALGSASVPVLLVVNKVDRVAEKERLLAFLRDKVDTARFAHVLLISARDGGGVADLELRVLQLLPVSQALHDADEFTDRSERFLAAELIREQLMLRLNQELPYAITVQIEEFKREPELLRIGAVIWVEREGQKHIVIGKGGQVLKQAGSKARGQLEDLFGCKVFLRTWVKVRADWSDDDTSLRQLGFDSSGA